MKSLVESILYESSNSTSKEIALMINQGTNLVIEYGSDYGKIGDQVGSALMRIQRFSDYSYSDNLVYPIYFNINRISDKSYIKSIVNDIIKDNSVSNLPTGIWFKWHHEVDEDNWKKTQQLILNLIKNHKIDRQNVNTTVLIAVPNKNYVDLELRNLCKIVTL